MKTVFTTYGTVFISSDIDFIEVRFYDQEKLLDVINLRIPSSQADIRPKCDVLAIRKILLISLEGNVETKEINSYLHLTK